MKISNSLNYEFQTIDGNFSFNPTGQPFQTAKSLLMDVWQFSKEKVAENKTK